MKIHVTHIGTATVLLEVGPLKILTDPVFGGAKHFHFGAGMTSDHTRGPWVPASEVPPPDLVLLSHDQHADNLDDEGRAIIANCTNVFSTPAASKRMKAVGLRDFESKTVGEVKITATPARHGPPLTGAITGPCIGFVLEWPGQSNGPLYISGDTVLFDGALEVARRFKIGTAFLHLGAAGYGPLRFTMNADEGAQLGKALGAKTLIPLHYEDWTHFKQPRSEVTPAFERAGLGHRLTWLEPGKRTELEV